MKNKVPQLNKDETLLIKSPVFEPRPGWGGQIKSWLKDTLGLRPAQFWAITAWVIVLLTWLKLK